MFVALDYYQSDLEVFEMIIEKAIQNRHLLAFTYSGFARTVEPHTYGIDSKGHRALRVYQVSGGSKFGEYVGWKMFNVDKIFGLSELPLLFDGPRPKFKRGDSAFRLITAEL
jgi:hypothetical protein